MPIFEYHCHHCQRDFEELVFNSREKIVCPDCQSDQCEKLMSVAVCRSKGADGSSTCLGGGGGCGGCEATSCSGCGCGA